MKKTFLLVAVLALASTAWGQQPESITLSRASSAGLASISGPALVRSAWLGDCDTRILSAYPKDGKLEIVKEQKCRPNFTYSMNSLTYEPNTRKVWKEIYAIQGEKIGLQSTVEARVIPAQDERVVWPDDVTRMQVEGGKSVTWITIPKSKHAHAQKPTAPKPLSEPVDIPFPPDEAKLLGEIRAQRDKLDAEFKVAEVQKEIEAARLAILTKHNIAEYQKRTGALVHQEQLVLQLAASKLSLTDEQQKTWLAQKDEKGVWVWRKPLEPPKNPQ